MIKTVNELKRADFSNWVINGNADRVLSGASSELGVHLPTFSSRLWVYISTPAFLAMLVTPVTNLFQLVFENRGSVAMYSNGFNIIWPSVLFAP